MSDVKGLVSSVKLHITGLKRAANVTKKRTQGVVDDFLSLNLIGGLDRMPYLATRVCQVTTHNDSASFRLFVETHFPLSYDSEKKMFKDEPIKSKEHKAKCAEARTTFMEEYDNNYWLWVQRNVKIEKKDVDWMQRVDSALASATNPEKGGFDLDDVLLHIVEKEGLNIETFMRILSVPVIESTPAIIQEQAA